MFHYFVGLCNVAVGIVSDEISPARPKYYAHSTSFAVVDECLEVNVGVQSFRKRFGVAPSLVYYNILNIVFCSKVDIVFVCRCIHARLEVHSGDVGIVPPVPSHLSRFYPLSVAYAAFRGEQLRHVAVHKLSVFPRHHYCTPRQRLSS